MLCKILFVSILFAQATAFASENSHTGDVKDNGKPANRYNGSAPIDLSRGLPFNNGTWGNKNEQYEAQSSAGYLAPGVSAAPYAYDRRSEFVAKIRDLFRIYEDAIDNLKTNKDQRPEVKAYREQMLNDLQTRLEAAKDATKRADGSSENEWSANQENARKTFADLQGLLVRNNTHY